MGVISVSAWRIGLVHEFQIDTVAQARIVIERVLSITNTTHRHAIFFYGLFVRI